MHVESIKWVLTIGGSEYRAGMYILIHIRYSSLIEHILNGNRIE